MSHIFMAALSIFNIITEQKIYTFIVSYQLYSMGIADDDQPLAGHFSPYTHEHFPAVVHHRQGLSLEVIRIRFVGGDTKTNQTNTT